MPRARPTLLDRVIANIDQRINWLKQERAEILDMQAKEWEARSRPARKPTRIAAVDPEKAS